MSHPTTRWKRSARSPPCRCPATRPGGSSRCRPCCSRPPSGCGDALRVVLASIFRVAIRGRRFLSLTGKIRDHSFHPLGGFFEHFRPFPYDSGNNPRWSRQIRSKIHTKPPFVRHPTFGSSRSRTGSGCCSRRRRCPSSGGRYGFRQATNTLSRASSLTICSLFCTRTRGKEPA